MMCLVSGLEDLRLQFLDALLERLRGVVAGTVVPGVSPQESAGAGPGASAPCARRLPVARLRICHALSSEPRRS